MATAGDTSPVQCSICFNSKVKRQPRVLPCQHSFCTECLTAWHNRRRQGNHNDKLVDCPECRTNVTLPPGGATALPIDINVEKITEVMNKTPSESQCHRCRQDGRSNEATVVCETCNWLLCEECGNQHKQVALFSSHMVKKSFCKVHCHGYLWLCATCSVGLCAECVHLGQHANHDVKDLNVGITDMKKKLNETTEMLKKPLSLLDKEIAAKRQECTAEENIQQTLLLMKKEIERIAESVEHHKVLHMSSVEQGLRENEELREHTVSVIKRSECLMKQDDDTFLANLPVPERESIQIKKRIETALELSPDHLRKQPNTCHIINADIIVETLKNCKLVCSVLKPMGQGMCISSKPILKIDCGKNCEITSPWHLCVTPDADIIVCQIKGPVYKLFKDGTKIQLHPDGNAACMQGDDVYVVSSNGDSVVQIKQEGHKVSHQLNPPIPDPTGIAVVGDMVLILNDSTLFKRMLSDASWNESFPIQSSLWNRLFHIRYREEDMLYVSSAKNDKITVYSKNGQVLHEFGRRGSKDGLFDYPTGITSIGDRHLLVADWSNHRIVQFKIDGTFVKNLLTKDDGLSYPADVAFRYPYLWVAEHKGTADSSLKLFKCL